ncbi:MAG: hypothetical protein U9O78_00010 [Patescibacteria group bacterium]|nr:hypothetical protein [Patescibacteria group bacterium]
MLIEPYHIPYYVAGIIFSSIGFLVIHIAKRDMEDKTKKDSKKE